jgi:hypothetical protein
MATKYRIVTTTRFRPRKPQQLGKYDVPVAAVELAEDIQRLHRALTELQQVDHTNIASSDTQTQRDHASAMLQSQIMLIRLWQRYAKRRLATKYLAP